jgi:alpha-amylase
LGVPLSEGDANLRSFMNWDDLERGGRAGEVLRHWRTLGRFRRQHPAVGAGAHRTLQRTPLVFSRTLGIGEAADRVLVAMDQGDGEKTIPVFELFPEGTELVDAYSGARGTVREGRVSLRTPSGLVLLSTPSPSEPPAAP